MSTNFGRPRRHLRIADSTNERARQLAEAGAPNGTVVTASEQTAGRGRHGRAWTAPPASALLYSAILRPLTGRHALLPLAVPLAACEAIEAAAPVRCEVKWPNDVWIEPDEFPPDLRWPATSVGHGASVERVLDALDEALSRWVDAPDDVVLEDFRRRDGLSGRTVSWEDAGEGTGTARGVDERGNLLVETGAGDRVALGAGEVRLVPR